MYAQKLRRCWLNHWNSAPLSQHNPSWIFFVPRHWGRRVANFCLRLMHDDGCWSAADIICLLNSNLVLVACSIRVSVLICRERKQWLCVCVRVSVWRTSVACQRVMTDEQWNFICHFASHQITIAANDKIQSFRIVGQVPGTNHFPIVHCFLTWIINNNAMNTTFADRKCRIRVEWGKWIFGTASVLRAHLY